VVLTVSLPDGTVPDTSGQACGARPGGGLVNPVSVIRYRIGPTADPGYAAAMAPTGLVQVTGEANRVELLREEIAPEDVAAGDAFDLTIVPTSTEVVAEFAVDLDFAAIVSTTAQPTTNPAGLALVPFDTAGNLIDGINPTLIRSVRVRLATRARVPDRESPSPSDTVTRWLLPGVTASNRYARMRTLHTEIQLPNMSQQVTF
jgi:hypothetical protein